MGLIDSRLCLFINIYFSLLLGLLIEALLRLQGGYLCWPAEGVRGTVLPLANQAPWFLLSFHGQFLARLFDGQPSYGVQSHWLHQPLNKSPWIAYSLPWLYWKSSVIGYLGPTKWLQGRGEGFIFVFVCFFFVQHFARKVFLVPWRWCACLPLVSLSCFGLFISTCQGLDMNKKVKKCWTNLPHHCHQPSKKSASWPSQIQNATTTR